MREGGEDPTLHASMHAFRTPPSMQFLFHFKFFPYLFAFAVGGLGCEFYVRGAGWRL